MQYDFDQVVDRRGTHAAKWDVAGHELPMWIADMDFLTAPEIIAAVRDRASHGIYGYTDVPEAWYDAILGWWRDRHGFHMERDWLIFSTGVVPTISSVVRKLTTPGENILTMTPVYNIFFHSIENNGRRVLECPLPYRDGTYGLDWADLEGKLADPQTTMLILCNPHNPVGTIWDRETLARVGELCWKHHVMVLSDEIHCDLTDPGCDYLPFASVSEHCRQNSITCIAPTKAFNLAGLQTSAVVVPDGVLRHKVWRALNTDEVAEPNCFAAEAAIAAFTRGGPWLDALRAYLAENKAQARDFLARELPQVRPVISHGTYLLWLDCGVVTGDSGALARQIRAQAGLCLSPGNVYRGNGARFLRMNLACPRSRMLDGLQRLRDGIRRNG
ncbi:MalY/PatB family protein [uncultured Intestinimonas sp.]|uniref:MalY/PatB family protein n=1 Tax=uncultured Intestinimonas sp. TaxID=1689265 RepID=UPI0025D3A8F3|nr:MalY/PatB family protein [uncultured Intestinimonas sp.]